MSGRFITLEGGEGVGKSTQIRALAAALAERGLEVVATRDGGRTEERVTEGVFTFVALDENHRPRPLPTA